MKDQVRPVRKIHTYGMRASDTAELRFENARAELLGARGRGREQALSVLDRGRIGIAALAVGIAEAAFDRAMQIHGGYGYSRDLPIERYLRDAKLCEIGEGTSQVQRLVIARHVLKEAKPLKLAHREPRRPNI